MAVTPATPATQAGHFRIDAPVAAVFPLFTALGERAWAPGWVPDILSGEQERGSAFRTRGPGGLQTTWIVTGYEPGAGRVSYARIAERSNIGLVDVACSRAPGAATEVTVRYTLTPLSAEGLVFVEHFLDAHAYAQMMEEWRTAIQAYLASGSGSR